MITENLSTLTIYKLTQEQYEKRIATGDIDESALYLTPEEEMDLSGYATTEQLDRKADSIHTHDIVNVNGLQSTLDSLSRNISTKSDTEHIHEISDITNLQPSLDEKVPSTRTINGKLLNEDIVLSASDIGADVSGSADAVLKESKAYTDSVKNDLLNGAGTAYDTLKELGDLINENTDAIEALETIASGKADNSHTHNDIYYTETEIDEKFTIINNFISNSVNEMESYVDVGDTTTFESSKTYTDNAVSQKSQVQIITWEDDD